MPDIVRERLELIIGHANVIAERIDAVYDAGELKDTKPGQLLLDSLITRLQALAENIKKIQKLEPAFFRESVALDINPIIRFRDLASHHYELLNHEIIFAICKREVPLLKQKVEAYLS